MRIIRLLPLLCVAIVAGCHTGVLPDPNDPKDVGSLSPDNMRDQIGSISDTLQSRVALNQITQKQAKDMLRQSAESMLVGFDPSKVDVPNAWKVAEVMMTANHWSDAKPVLIAAIEWAKTNHNEDRRINDTLRLAHVVAELGDIPEALKIARSTFSVEPGGAAPILFAVYLDLPPAIRGKGFDVELAELIEDAIKVNLTVKVDPKSEAGRVFLQFRPTHVWSAWSLVFKLYESAKRPDLLEKAKANAMEMSKTIPPPKQLLPSSREGSRPQGFRRA